jgi:hypothetical protein
MSKINLVIARYKEDLTWLKNVPENLNIIVYNKDDTKPISKIFTRVGWQTKGSNPSPLNAPDGVTILRLPNIGREADTYLTHIIDNYDNLGDITIFCQGNPFDHSPDMLKLLEYTDKYKNVQPLTDRYLDIADMPPKSILESNKTEYINDAKVSVHPISFYNFQTLEYHDSGSYNVLEPFMKHFKIQNGTNIIEYVMKVNNFTIKDQVPPIGYFCFAAIFAVSKQNILQHSKQAYINLRNMNNKGNELCASAIERMWLYIFGYDKEITISNIVDSVIKESVDTLVDLVIETSTLIETPIEIPIPIETSVETPTVLDAPTPQETQIETPTVLDASTVLDAPIPQETQVDAPTPQETQVDAPMPQETQVDAPTVLDVPAALDAPIPQETQVDTPTVLDVPAALDTPTPPETPTLLETPTPLDEQTLVDTQEIQVDTQETDYQNDITQETESQDITSTLTTLTITFDKENSSINKSISKKFNKNKKR